VRSGDKRVIREWELLCQRERLGVALGAERLSEAWQPQNARLAVAAATWSRVGLDDERSAEIAGSSGVEPASVCLWDRRGGPR